MKRKWKIQALKVTVTSLLPPIIVNQVSNKKTMETENEFKHAAQKGGKLSVSL